MMAHSSGELWGLSCSPNGSQFVTCGGDASIRVYDVATNSIQSLFYEKTDVRAVDWSSNASFIVAADVSGKIHLFTPDLDKIDENQSSFTKQGQWIEEIKFSPDSSMVAFGAHGGVSPLEVMLVSNNKLQKHAVIKTGFTSALLHLDWSVDSTCIVTNSEAYELKFINVKS